MSRNQGKRRWVLIKGKRVYYPARLHDVLEDALVVMEWRDKGGERQRKKYGKA